MPQTNLVNRFVLFLNPYVVTLYK